MAVFTHGDGDDVTLKRLLFLYCAPGFVVAMQDNFDFVLEEFIHR
jgi:hypothetical protein